MKKILSILLFTSILLFSTCNIFASSECHNIQYLENGDYIISSEISYDSSFARTTRSNSKVCTYYAADNTAIFSIILSATFDYTYGVQSLATSSNIRVQIKSGSAIFKSKTSSVSGNTANGSATVFYQGADRTIYVSMTCDIYGNVR